MVCPLPMRVEAVLMTVDDFEMDAQLEWSESGFRFVLSPDDLPDRVPRAVINVEITKNKCVALLTLADRLQGQIYNPRARQTLSSGLRFVSNKVAQAKCSDAAIGRRGILTERPNSRRAPRRSSSVYR